jgi:predicted glycosyltransferase
LPQTKILLVLRDILDAPANTISAWTRRGCYNTVQWYYDEVLVLGTREIFDVCTEYHFPKALCEKVRFCGYVAREAPSRSRDETRQQLGVARNDELILVTTGGGEDGFHILSASMEAMRLISRRRRVQGVVVSGPELAPDRAKHIRAAARSCTGVRVVDFVDDMMSYMNAADAVISMAGYNTVCELLTLNKRSILVPRVRPVEEQKIRAERMSRVPFFTTILPDALSPALLANTIMTQLDAAKEGVQVGGSIDLCALPRISAMLRADAGLVHGFESACAPMMEMVS